MAESHTRWIDDVSDEYDSEEEEVATQPCSVSPARRDSVYPQDRAVLKGLAVDCLLKQIDLMQPPYQFLLSGISYNLKNAKKLAKKLFPNSGNLDLEYRLLFKGETHTGKAVVTTRCKEAAETFVRLHGTKVLNRVLAVDVCNEYISPPKPQPHKRTGLTPTIETGLCELPLPKSDSVPKTETEAASPMTRVSSSSPISEEEKPPNDVETMSPTPRRHDVCSQEGVIERKYVYPPVRGRNNRYRARK